MGEILGIGCSHGPGITGPLNASDGYLLAPQFAKRTYAGSYEGPKELAEKDAGGVGRR